MTEEPRLRERKKLQTRRALWHTAIGLFVERGFDNVSVAEIAAATDVSKKTVFNYFPAKEDLVMAPMEEHVDEPARIVRDRAAGESAVTALRRHFVAALAARDAATGLSDAPETLDVQRLIRTTPTLMQRAYAFFARSEDLLAREFAAQTQAAGTAAQVPAIAARVAAAQIMGVRNALVAENLRRILDGESADAVHPSAVANAEHAFDVLENGLGSYCTREAVEGRPIDVRHPA
ncbi:TetR family transcriptional regulator [Streptosporangium sp. NBC_01756]|uniref:TetR family transcriptional regulator n=1 Tax=Streptosporangium sp. NBC_01756 TaxID=2975950 RepID=UPI002DD9765C|nr:TetR family transcriptional regulator [Streptosporangium sp. NBC_01756]WSC84771.1 TetR/AcrR family transcriptional regulator [Streptosporangium sp. NBC_01756]